MIHYAEFERCWKWLELAVERHGKTHSKEDVWRQIATENAWLLPMPNSAVVGNLRMYPNGLKRANAWLAGADDGHLHEILSAVPLMEGWARSMGCRQTSINGRRGWLGPLKELGYEEKSVLLLRNLP